MTEKIANVCALICTAVQIKTLNTCFQSCNNVNYHMTSMAPRVISLEIHKKKVPEWGSYALRTDSAGKTHTALLEMHTAPQKQCETILYLQEKNCHMIKCLLTEWGQARLENIWLSSWLWAKYFRVRPSHSVNKYIIPILKFYHTNNL